MPISSLIRLPLLSAGSLALVLLGAGCSDQTSAAGVAASDTANGAQIADGLKDAAHVSDNVQVPLSETDSMELTSAVGACASREKESFFESFVMSAEVRRRYSAPFIQYSVRQIGPEPSVLRQERIAAANYRDFPIRMSDFYYISTSPATPGDQAEYILFDINQSQSNQLSVEWTRVHFDGKTEGGDDLGNAFLLDGRPYRNGGLDTDGKLLFEATDDCWQLVADIRHQNSGA